MEIIEPKIVIATSNPPKITGDDPGIRRRISKKFIPIAYIVKAQHLYVRIFEWEDDDGIPCDEYRSYTHCKKAYDEYLEKMFLDDTETANHLDRMFNNALITSGDYKQFCDYLRSRGYEVLSKDNATKEEHNRCKQECLKAWKEWKRNKGK